MELSVLIVNYNARDPLRNCLTSLYQSTSLRPLEVVVVDNDSGDGSVTMLREHFPEVRVIASQENVGFARANNVAMREAGGRFHLLLNNDTLVPPGAIDTMLRILRDRPDVGALGPRLRSEDGSVQVSFGKMVGFRAEAVQKLLQRSCQSGNRLLRSYVERRSRKETHPDWVSGACMMLRSDLPPDARFFDEAFFMYLEDVDLCQRIRKHGFKILYTPEAEIVHLGGRSVETNRERVTLEYRRSHLYFYSKHYGRSRLRLLKAYLLAKTALGWVLGGPAERTVHRRLLALLWTY